MDCRMVGQLILNLRKEMNLTQKQLADKINVSDKAVSKWECGLGCPDITLLHKLAETLNVNIEKILSGDLSQNDTDGGNMKKLRFYLCPKCGNIMTSTGEAELSCCGRKLVSLTAQKSDEKHHLNVETIEDDFYITFSHEMTKTHYISFIAYVSFDRVFLVRLYPEQSGEVRIPKLYGGKLYFCCNQHGLYLN